MDSFFTKKKCDRCGKDLRRGRCMSMFNTDCICPECKEKERRLPEYQDAVEAERKAIASGDYNFKGIGYPVE